MSLEVIREAIRVNQIIGQESTQTVVENDIIVPDVKPDIAYILILDGDVYVNSSEVVQDRILVNGTICYKILYVSDDAEQSIKSINTSSGFSYSMDVANAKPGMKCRVKCDIEHIGYEILNGRKVNIKAIVKMAGRVTSELEQGIAYDLSGLDDIQMLKKHYKVNSYLGESEANARVSEVLEIPDSRPAIREILRNDVKISDKDYKITDNKIIARCQLNVSTLYIGDDETGSIQFMKHEIPFSQTVDLPGITEDAGCELEYRITDSSFEAEEDSDGELRALKCEIGLCILADGFEQREVEAIEDAYSPNARVEIEKEPFNAEEFVSENKSQIAVKDIITVGGANPEISEVFNVLCKPVLSQYSIEDDKIMIEGLVNSKVLYLANNAEQPVFCREQETPINQAVDIKGIKPGMDCEIDLDIQHCSYSTIDTKEVEIKLSVLITIKVVKRKVISVIKRANEAKLDAAELASQPSITIYFVQQGDTLWDIAKKYYTTIADIIKANDMDENDAVSLGQQVIIPKKFA